MRTLIQLLVIAFFSFTFTNLSAQIKNTGTPTQAPVDKEQVNAVSVKDQLGKWVEMPWYKLCDDFYKANPNIDRQKVDCIESIAATACQITNGTFSSMHKCRYYICTSCKTCADLDAIIPDTHMMVSCSESPNGEVVATIERSIRGATLRKDQGKVKIIE
jgi:hypothetical protein